jgi:hypothetical protein
MSLSTRVAAKYAAKVQRSAVIKAVKEAFLRSGGNTRLLQQDRTPASIPLLSFWWPERAGSNLDWSHFTQLLQAGGLKIKEKRPNAVKVEYPEQTKPSKSRGLPEGTAGYVWAGVLAGAYLHGSPKEDRSELNHAIWVDARGDWLGEKTACNKIRLDRMADVGGQKSPFCSACESRVRRLKQPHLPKFENLI